MGKLIMRPSFQKLVGVRLDGKPVSLFLGLLD
jgi:hypothetical protein